MVSVVNKRGGPKLRRFLGLSGTSQHAAFVRYVQFALAVDAAGAGALVHRLEDGRCGRLD